MPTCDFLEPELLRKKNSETWQFYQPNDNWFNVDPDTLINYDAPLPIMPKNLCGVLDSIIKKKKMEN